MLVADTHLGNVSDDADLADRVSRSDALTVTVSETERRRSRFRTTTDDDTELGVVVSRELREDDVLAAEDTLVRVSLKPVEAMVVNLADVASDLSAVTAALQLGHHVGNRHWNLAVEGEQAYFPVTDSRERMEAEVEPVLPDGAALGYEEVSPSLFDESEADHGHGDGGHSHDDGGHTHGIRKIDPEGSS